MRAHDQQGAPFIMGVPRSGTTLLRLMLDAHSDLAIPPETHFVGELAQRGAARLSAESFGRFLVQSERWEDFHLSAVELLKALKPFTRSAGLRCFYRLYARCFDKNRWGDKTPLYCLNMREIQSVLPEAHFVHIIRDGRDAFLSENKTWWTEGNLDVGVHAKFWTDTIAATRRNARFCNHFLELRYEDLLREPARTLKKVCEYLKLPYRSEMLRYHDSAPARLRELGDLFEPDGTVGATRTERRRIHKLAHRPPDPSRIGCWREEMSLAAQTTYQSVAGKMLRNLGYEP